MWWILVWTVLVLAALSVLGLLLWRLVRQVLALGRELGASAERIGPVMDQIAEPYRPAASVLADPAGAPQPRRSGHRSRSRVRR